MTHDRMPEHVRAWLERFNEECAARHVPLKRRPWDAWRALATEFGMALPLEHPTVRDVFSWFARNTQPGAQRIGPMFRAAFYFDACVWPVVLPVVFGTVRLNAWDTLVGMPDPVRERLARSPDAMHGLATLVADAADYAYAVYALHGDPTLPAFARDLLRSADKELEASVAVLLGDRPTVKAAEAGRMGTEMFLKALLAARDGLTEQDARRPLGHDIDAAAARCLGMSAAPPDHALAADLSSLARRLGVFPPIAARYRAPDVPLHDLWRAYVVAQQTGALVARWLFGRSTRGGAGGVPR